MSLLVQNHADIEIGGDQIRRERKRALIRAQCIVTQAQHLQRNVRLDTLVRLRWLTVIGQTTAVLVVHFGLEYTLPIWACLAVIALSAWLNIALRVRFRVLRV